jgi:hypothetical protein
MSELILIRINIGKNYCRRLDHAPLKAGVAPSKLGECEIFIAEVSRDKPLLKINPRPVNRELLLVTWVVDRQHIARQRLGIATRKRFLAWMVPIKYGNGSAEMPPTRTQTISCIV